MHEKRILVCVSQSPASHKLIHIASQIAASEQAMFSAVCVIEPRHNTPEDTDLKRCMEHMDYARNLGADAELIFGHFIALRIAAYAKSRGASKIVLGRSILKKDIPVSRRYLAKELKILLPDIEVTTVPNTSHSYDEKEKPEKIRVRIGDIWVSAAILTVTTLLCWWFEKLGLNDLANEYKTLLQINYPNMLSADGRVKLNTKRERTLFNKLTFGQLNRFNKDTSVATGNYSGATKTQVIRNANQLRLPSDNAAAANANAPLNMSPKRANSGINVGLSLPEASTERVTSQSSTGDTAREAEVDPQNMNPVRRTTLPAE